MGREQVTRGSRSFMWRRWFDLVVEPLIIAFLAVGGFYAIADGALMVLAYFAP